LLLISSIDIAKHAIRCLIRDEQRIFFKEEDETLFVVVENFFPEVVAFLVAFAGGAGVYTAGMICLTEFESEYHQEGVAREGFEEELLVVNFYLAVDFAQ
jgi:hypothetical protein